MEQVNEILLWLFVINLGVAFGAGLYEMRIILPRWFIRTSESDFAVDVNAMKETDTGRRFWGMATTVPLTLLTIANLVLALRSGGQKHDWWLAASLIVLVERIGTFFFFIPTAIKFMSSETLPASRIAGMVLLWIRMNYLRNALTLLGWLAALRVLSAQPLGA